MAESRGKEIMKQFIVFVLIFLAVASSVSAETNGEFENRVYLLNSRAESFWQSTPDYYTEWTEDQIAKVIAYSFWLSDSLDRIYLWPYTSENKRKILETSDMWRGRLDHLTDWIMRNHPEIFDRVINNAQLYMRQLSEGATRL